MSKEVDVLGEEQSSAKPVDSITWFETWKMAITRPSVTTFERITCDPNASSLREYKWIFFGFVIGNLLFLSVQFVSNSSAEAINCYFPLNAIVAVFLTIIQFQKFLAIDEWRKELSLEK